MPFGLLPFKMNKRIALFAIIALLPYSCRQDKKDDEFTISPDAGSNYKSGEQIALKIGYPKDVKIDSVVYLLDSTRVGSAKDSATVTVKTDSIALGARVITAKVYQGGKSQDLTTNINLLAAKAPEQLGFVIEKVFPHDTSSYTEGLEYQDGILYESDGGRAAEGNGQSSLRKVDLTTGKVLKITNIDPKIFAEGIAVIGDKIVQLTYTEKIGFVYDKKTLTLLSKFDNNVGLEGWGMTHDADKIYMDDSTNRIWFLNKDTYQQKGFIDVYDDKGPINELNELEYIDGKIYANVYHQDYILVINPKTGAVEQKIDLTSLYPEGQRNPHADVLNGIAYDKATKRIFITGKKWDKLFQVKFVKK
ncbi:MULTISPECIES: glutaminyl-peptide cyclotransferase [unclassified Mucilaginibacter]|uniref:glutaminyl-peptide cyclotransferase n=1 Tax=unclassified Mucilaginibacter TaxID=2617802 RepID=UPI002AC8B085|nr:MULTISPECIES: glutaminyl-peptide cyclotransferase [unclassified Mucilaginibacter]MEB0263524.1 glutaminyl-peptide cyclotransferase [Mucilaginibacter sp. 10I4]MEB0280146.1 glutaminyl-peptide cyclotransferase [Mucilaginibacter sp. 10B2]MEB0301650.1 glutaminyl-peptide cyclotransferase [Mucilaginibacter sp. 5C4]WPX24445.1 glutaminyl-peptide cyclotransferase [Mucilaginibacter sp. 5C4]